ncbi:MAG: SurA N-terminal domain-containing protein [Nitrospirota bacterium]|nr:SurA N-terminal domain-containing protein [Nitrospirota bacterium]
MVFRYGLILAVLFLVPLMGGCSKPPATVDGKAISKEKVELHMKDRMQEHKLQNASVDQKKMKEAILQELIGEQLALNEAAAKGIKVTDAEVGKEVDMLRKNLGEEKFQKALKDKGLTPESYRNRRREQMILTRFVEGLVNTDEVTDQELRDVYKNSSKPFLKPARVNMKIVEFQAEDAARAAADEIKKTKADFDEYAKKLSDEKKASVTDYGWVAPDFFSPSMASSIKMLKDGQQGGPYKGQAGFYLVRVKERQNEGIAAFDEVKETIRATLLQQKRSDAFMQWIEQKRKTAKIVINLK